MPLLLCRQAARCAEAFSRAIPGFFSFTFHRKSAKNNSPEIRPLASQLRLLTLCQQRLSPPPRRTVGTEPACVNVLSASLWPWRIMRCWSFCLVTGSRAKTPNRWLRNCCGVSAAFGARWTPGRMNYCRCPASGRGSWPSGGFCVKYWPVTQPRRCVNAKSWLRRMQWPAWLKAAWPGVRMKNAGWPWWTRKTD